MGFQVQPCTPYFDSFSLGRINCFSPDPTLTSILESRKFKKSTGKFTDTFDISSLTNENEPQEQDHPCILASTHCLLLFDVANELDIPLELNAVLHDKSTVCYVVGKKRTVRLAVPIERVDLSEEKMNNVLGIRTKQFVKSKLTVEEELLLKRRKCHKLHILSKIQMNWRDPSRNRTGHVYLFSISVNNTFLKQMTTPRLQFSYSLIPENPKATFSSELTKKLPQFLPFHYSAKMGHLASVFMLEVERIYSIKISVKNQSSEAIPIQLSIIPSQDGTTSLTGDAYPTTLAHKLCYIGSLVHTYPDPLLPSQSVSHTLSVFFLLPGIYYFSIACLNLLTHEVSHSPSILGVVVNSKK